MDFIIYYDKRLKLNKGQLLYLYKRFKDLYYEAFNIPGMSPKDRCVNYNYYCFDKTIQFNLIGRFLWIRSRFDKQDSFVNLFDDKKYERIEDLKKWKN